MLSSSLIGHSSQQVMTLYPGDTCQYLAFVDCQGYEGTRSYYLLSSNADNRDVA